MQSSLKINPHSFIISSDFLSLIFIFSDTALIIFSPQTGILAVNWTAGFLNIIKLVLSLPKSITSIGLDDWFLLIKLLVIAIDSISAATGFNPASFKTEE